MIADENKLKEILINLIGNAIKFTSKGGITLHLWSEKDPKNNLPGALRLLIDVQDTGIGIAKEELHKLFRAFEQTSSGNQTFGGTCLGWRSVKPMHT